MQAFSSTLYGQFPGYEQPHFDVVLQTDNVSYIQSPQVRAAVRRHFDCPALLGAALEDDLGRGSSGSHWEMRLFRVRPAPRTPDPTAPGTRLKPRRPGPAGPHGSTATERASCGYGKVSNDVGRDGVRAAHTGQPTDRFGRQIQEYCKAV